MSAINGDKSRAAIARKRGVHRRARIRQLLEARKQQTGAAKVAAPPKKTGNEAARTRRA